MISERPDSSAYVLAAGAVVRSRNLHNVYRESLGVYHAIWLPSKNRRAAEFDFKVTPINAGAGGGGEVLIQDGVGPAGSANAGLRVNVTVDLIPAVVPGMTMRVQIGGMSVDRVIDTVAGDRRSVTVLVAFPFFEANVWDVYQLGASAARVATLGNDGTAAPPGGANAPAGSRALRINVFDDTGAPADSDFLFSAKRA